jgi:hypothetical protein
MADPKLKKTSVVIRYTASTGHRAEMTCKAGEDVAHLKTGKPVPPEKALLSGIEELARLLALFGFEQQAREAVDGAFGRVAEWRKSREAGNG